jgi:hypothetical protein
LRMNAAQHHEREANGDLQNAQGNGVHGKQHAQLRGRQMLANVLPCNHRWIRSLVRYLPAVFPERGLASHSGWLCDPPEELGGCSGHLIVTKV